MESIHDKIIQQIGSAYSYLEHRCVLTGDVEAIKFLYRNVYFEKSPLIKAISLLQLQLTLKEIRNDTQNIYGDEFLYYWGMICLGEGSRLIARNLDTAKVCFEKLIKVVPKVKARLAYIELLVSADPHTSDDNIRRVDILRIWAGRRDMFSMIVLAKIVYEHFLDEKQPDDLELPIEAIRLLEIPYQQGHPEAIKFYNAMLDNAVSVGIPDIISRKIDSSHINTGVLYDF